MHDASYTTYITTFVRGKFPNAEVAGVLSRNTDLMSARKPDGITRLATPGSGEDELGVAHRAFWPRRFMGETNRPGA